MQNLEREQTNIRSGLSRLRELASGANSGIKNTQEANIDELTPSKHQSRKRFDEVKLSELSESIKQQGIIQPIIVRFTGGDKKYKYEIIAGERRWRAAILAGLKKVPIIVKDVSDEIAAAFVLIENIQRDDLTVIEEAFSYQRLMSEFKLTQAEVAERVGKPRSTVTNYLRLTRLAKPVQQLLEERKLDFGHAKVLAGVEDSDLQVKLANEVVKHQLTVRKLELLIKQDSNNETGITKPIPHECCDEWSRVLSEKLSSKVAVKINEYGEGKVIINIDSVQDVDWLIENL